MRLLQRTGRTELQPLFWFRQLQFLLWPRQLHDLPGQGTLIGRQFTISPKVTTIGANTFNNCISIKAITIPEAVATIGPFAFSGWTYGQTIYVEGKTWVPDTGWTKWIDGDSGVTIVWDA